MTNKKDMKTKTPPNKLIASAQFDLFRHFVTNDKSEVSNTVDIWERIPKYFFTAKQIEKLRPEKGQPDPYEWEYKEGGYEYTVIIQPALIKVNGGYKAYFPSVTEELVEEALKKILTDQQYGIHDPQNVETWVRFSLSMIYRELKGRERERNRNQIKHAILVMSRCNITLLQNSKEIWSGSILQDLVTVDREEYIEDADSHHIARLPLFISHAINRLDYRQYNYARLMGCNNQLSRSIYKRLVNRFKNANLINDYHILYTTLKHTGLLQQARETDNRKKVMAALEELEKAGVLRTFDTDERKQGRTVIDVKYTLYPASDFIAEQKAANKRGNDNYHAALNRGWSPTQDELPTVDK
jgi:hypothetical protein